MAAGGKEQSGQGGIAACPKAVERTWLSLVCVDAAAIFGYDR
jgi:hypothetical protein